MSIIYDALKKTQDKREAAVEVTPQRKRNYWKMAKIIILAGLWIATLIYVPSIIKKFQSKPKPPVVALAKVPPIILNGVFISPTSRMVEINNHFFQVGEVVNGMKIVNINYNKITFLHQNKMLEMQVPV